MSVQLLDKDNNPFTVELPTAVGRAAATGSKPVALANEDKAALDLVHTDLAQLHTDMQALSTAVGLLATAAKQPNFGTAGTASSNVLTIQGIASMTAVKVDGSAVTQPVSLVSVPLPTGAATAAKQPALGTSGTASTDVLTIQGIAGMIAVKIDGSAVTQPVSLASVPLPAGAATAANQTSELTKLDTLATNQTSGLTKLDTLHTDLAAKGSIFYTGTTTPLAGSATYTGTTRDTGVAAGTVHPYSYYNGFFLADQAGTAYLDCSNDGTTWYVCASNALTANAPLTLTVPVMSRYHRTRLVNGSTNQTSLVVNSSYTAG